MTLIRAALPQHLHDELKHLSVDLGRPVIDLMVDAAILLLRYHDRGAGLPEPDPPNAPAPKPTPMATKKGAAR
jgi:hypothetical protein